MLPEEAIEELLKPVFDAVRAAARDIFAQGHIVGSQSAVQAILQNATTLFPATPSLVSRGWPVDFAQPHTVEAASVPTLTLTDAVEAEVVRRAPKGLVDEVLDHVLQTKPGMTQEEVEAAVVAIDSRIAVKSVYNKLRAWEKQGRRFRRQGGLWYRIADIPAPFPMVPKSPQGETGGATPPALLPDIL